MHDIAPQVERWLAEGKAVALATVVETWGSAPRRAGAMLAATADLAFVGSVSGGCVESAVLAEMGDCLIDGQARLLTYGVSDETAWEVGLACGGTITVSVEPLDPAAWRRLVEASAPPPTLLVIGGGHVAVALVRLAGVMGFRCVVIDPRSAFATPERFPDAQIIHAYPDAALARLTLDSHALDSHALNSHRLDSQTYAAVLSHDPKIDDPALIALLARDLPYIGVMSSRATHAARVARLTAAGIAPERIASLRSPIGLNIGARTPEEIALAILAEITAVRNGA